jgi:hypothetical protein
VTPLTKNLRSPSKKNFATARIESAGVTLTAGLS